MDTNLNKRTRFWFSRTCLSRFASVMIGVSLSIGPLAVPRIETLFAAPGAYRWSLSMRKENVGRSIENSRDHSSVTPLSFEPTLGQTDSHSKFVARTSACTFLLASTEVALSLGAPGSTAARRRGDKTRADVRIRFAGGAANPALEGIGKLPGRSNYFIGNDPEKWVRDVPSYSKVRYKDIYPLVDAVFYGDDQQRLEYDLILAPGAIPETIRIVFDGVRKIELDVVGDLLLRTAVGVIRQKKPSIYQQKDGKRSDVEGGYVVKRANQVGFHIGAYDPGLPLVIDPVLSFSTYLGGSSEDIGNAIAVDSAGSVYVTGRSSSVDFPTAAGGGKLGGVSDVFVTKLNAAGNGVVYSTYIGGTGFEEGLGIAVDSMGNAYLAGSTSSADFPTTGGAFQTVKNGGTSAFAVKLNSTGNGLVYSTYLNGVDNFVHPGGAQSVAFGIAVDSSGEAYVTGRTDALDFPVQNAIQPNYMRGTCGGDALFPCPDAFLTKLNPAGTGLVYSTYLGGSGSDEGRSVALDFTGAAVVVGTTSSTDFPMTHALQPSLRGHTDVFVTRLTLSGDSLVYSTYLGGSDGDAGIGVAVDSAGNTYVTGRTLSTDFPTANALQSTRGGCPPGPATDFCNDAFVAKLDSSGSALLYSTYLGGNNGDFANSIAVDSAGNAYVTGQTFSDDFPTKNALQSFKRGGSSVSDIFVAKLNAAGSSLLFSTYLGGKKNDIGSGIAVDSFSSAYITGSTASPKMPRANAFQFNYGGGDSDAFVAKIAAPRIISVSISGKNLLVVGEGFDLGAVIVLNGEEQRTLNDQEHITTALIGKKVGNKISPAQTVKLQVRNAEGTVSEEFSFTR